MTDLVLTDAAKAYLAEQEAEESRRRAVALNRALLKGDGPPTEEDWRILQETSPPRRRAPQQPSERPEPPRAA